MAYKFEKLEVWTRAANSIALNIAEGSTGQSDAEQGRFLRIAIRSLLETVACFHLINRRDYLDDLGLLREAYHDSETLFAKLQAFRTSLDTDSTVWEAPIEYDEGAPF